MKQPKTPSPQPQPKQYQVLVGFNYGAHDRRHEIGEIVSLPSEVADLLLAHTPPAITADTNTIPLKPTIHSPAAAEGAQQ